jgi:hypothetical protein
LVGLFFYPEDGSGMFLGNVFEILWDNAALCPIIEAVL